jgi:NAD(P)-dependent dehydrogenase (short-subunit alcohol dehydrogenase family)
MRGLAVVTGAAGGIGGACARRFARDGYDLLLVDVGQAPLDSTAAALRGSGARVETLAGDIASPDFPAAVAAAVGERTMTLLLHAAGLSPSMADPARIVDVNLFASARLADALVAKAGEGAVAVLIASSAGHMPISPEADAAFEAPLAADGLAALTRYTPTPQAAYSLSKRGVRALVRRRAAAWGERGARIVSISPGIIDTAMSKAEFAREPAMAAMQQFTPLKRMGSPDEIAAVAAFLASPEASYVTGVDLLVDGGVTGAMGG